LNKKKLKYALWLTLKITWIPALFFVAAVIGLVAGYGFILAHAQGSHRDITAILGLGRGILSREIWLQFFDQIKELR
jgi:hypothetical protein